VKSFFIKNRHLLFNSYLFINILGWSAYQSYNEGTEGRFNFTEIIFAIHNVTLCAFILLRRNHLSIDKSITHQAVAIVAFFSGLTMMGQAPTGGETAKHLSEILVLLSYILGIVTLFNLGRSFGILIAFRGIRTSGLYSLIRHPMYFTDIMVRVGFLVYHWNTFTVSMCILSSGCYVYRAILEERFLRSQPGYRDYMERVRYRFIPYIF
jgi:protein-S-isoprenylcysteine O-methyltransferase Ste14